MEKLILDLDSHKSRENAKIRSHAKNPFKSPFFGGEERKFEFGEL